MSSKWIRGVRAVSLSAADLDEAAKFYGGIFALQPVEAGHGARRFRGTGGYHHILALQSGPRSAILRVVFDVLDRASIDALHGAIVAAGCAAGRPADHNEGYGFSCTDPEGRNLAFFADAPDHADTKDVPDRPRKIAHVNLNTGDFDATFGFFTQVLGFRLADENLPLTFLRANSSDHSSIVLARADAPTLNHVAFEMPDLDSLMRGIGRLKDHGFPPEWGPGRHGPGNNVFAYFAGPEDMPLEYTWGVLQIDDSHVPRLSDYWKFPPGRSDRWGVTAPRTARWARIQRLIRFSDDARDSETT
jgi:catechol 2,3-dioxygenase